MLLTPPDRQLSADVHVNSHLGALAAKYRLDNGNRDILRITGRYDPYRFGATAVA